MYEEKEYNVRKIKDFIAALDGFRSAQSTTRFSLSCDNHSLTQMRTLLTPPSGLLQENFANCDGAVSSSLLRSLISVVPPKQMQKGVALYPDLTEV